MFMFRSSLFAIVYERLLWSTPVLRMSLLFFISK